MVLRIFKSFRTNENKSFMYVLKENSQTNLQDLLIGPKIGGNYDSELGIRETNPCGRTLTNKISLSLDHILYSTTTVSNV